MALSPLPLIFTDAGTLEPQGYWGKIQRWAMVPLKQSNWQKTDYINTLDDEFTMTLIPMIMTLNEEYFVVNQTVSITSSTAPLVIPIPTDAIGANLRDVHAIAGSGAGAQQTKCNRVDPNQLPFTPTSSGWAQQQGPVYYIQNNQVVFPYPMVPLYTTILMRYFKKPNKLVSRGNCAIVTATNTSLNTITCDNTNSNAAFYTGQTLDFLNGTVPFPFDAYQITPSVVNIQNVPGTYNANGTTFSVDAATAAAVQVGDIVCPTGTAPVMQYVDENVADVVTQSALCRLLSSVDDDTALAREQARLDEYMARLQRLLTPKVASESKTLVSPRDASSTLGTQVGWGGYGGAI